MSIKVKKHKKLLIRYLVNKGQTKAKVSIIKGPVIRYKYKRTAYIFKPKIKIQNSWVEVKSANSLFNAWQRNVLKARACEKHAKNNKGQSFKTAITVGKVVYLLPKNWYKLDIKSLKKRVLTYPEELLILALDPGVTNAAWATLRITQKPFTVNILASGMLKHTIKSLKENFMQESKKFLDEIQQLVEKYAIDSIVLERFMTRGNLGTTIELVNVMIGALLAVKPKIKRLNLITAAQWKNECNKQINLSTVYKQMPCTPHQLDACLIGLYGAYVWFDEKPYFNLKKIQSKLLTQIEQTNLGKVFNRRVKR